MGRVAAEGKGLLVVAERGEEGESTRPWAVRYWNVLNEDYFQSDWRADATIVDNRDAMHKRGWTYFRVRGRLHDRDVTGVGRLPFVYAAAREHNPWLKLRIGENLTIVDSDASACVLDGKDTVLSKYTRGSFFKGLARPWMGLHTMDMVRRDAAERKIPFQTAVTPDGQDVLVTILHDQVKLVYTIDLEIDVVENIAFFVGDAPAGRLEFEYLQDLPESGREFTVPKTRSYRGSTNEDKGILWLVRLANGTLAD
jgi:hypothetical protein